MQLVAVKCFLNAKQSLPDHLTGEEGGQAGLGGGGGALGPGSRGLGSVRTGHPGPACWVSEIYPSGAGQCLLHSTVRGVETGKGGTEHLVWMVGGWQ